MALFQYIASSDKNKTTTGIIEAQDEASVIAALTKQNLRPLSVTHAKKAGGFNLNSLLGGDKVKSDDLVIFTRQLSAMVGAGVPLLRSLSSLEAHTESPGLKNILVNVIRDVEGGSTLGDALDKYPS